MKKKKFSELDISEFIQPLPKQFIDMWQTYNDDDEFIKRIYFVTRDIYNIIRNAAPTVSTKHSVFTGRQAEKVPRFDKMITKAAEIDRTKAIEHAKLKPARVEHDYLLSRTTMSQKDMKMLYAPVLSTKQYKQDFLRG